MNAEKSQKNYEGDENVENESVQEVVEDKLVEKAGRAPFPTSQINTFSTEEQENQREKAVEKGMAKRTLPRSAHQNVSETTILENHPLSKRAKLTTEEHMNEGKLSIGEICEDSLDGTSNTAGETLERVVTNACPGSNAFISNALSMQNDLMPESSDFVQETHVENEHSQEVPTLLPEHISAFPNNETSISCTTNGNENVSKCKTCEETFATPADLEKHIQESHLKQTSSMNPHYVSESNHGSTFHMRVKQMSGQLRYFCDLCGFQSFEEDHLRTHFLGKTHLRRQNLAARGGFVKMLTKKPFHKKQQFPVKEKNVRTIAALNKPKIRSTASNQLRMSSNKMKNLEASCKLFVEMVPSKNISSETAESITSEEVFICNMDENSGVQTEKLDASPSLDCNPQISEPAEETFSSLNATGVFDRLHHKKSILSRRGTFRKSGSLRLNQQIKRRYNLLGMGKRSKLDSSFKHSIRGEISHSDLSQVKDLQIKNDDNPLGKAASEMQSVDPDATNSCSSPTKAVNIQKRLNPCTHCLYTLPKSEGLELDVDRVNAEEVKFNCQTCGYSCATREDIELHCQKNSHSMGDHRSNCLQCSSFPPKDISLGKHLCDKHSVSHHCVTCHMYFSSEEEVTAHNETEQHISLLAQENTAQQLKSDLALQTPSSAAVESNVLPMVEEVKTQQEIPKPSIIHSGHESSESVLSRSQFQCKKCFYKTRSSSVLTRHIKLRHAQEYHFLCKACNLYSLSKEGMEKHIKRSKHLENARKNNIGLRFEECIERVCVGTSEGKKVTEATFHGAIKTASEIEGLNVSHYTWNVSLNKELFPSGETIKDNELVQGTVQKRGRPKGTISRTCPHCGLLASSVTNLTVHIRRKHSHQYSYLCKVCNYYTVTKGDMERHCATKKHKGRLEVGGGGNVEIVVCPEGGNGENSSKKINSPVEGLNESVDHGNQSSTSESAILERQGNDQGSTISTQAENVIQLPELDVSRNSSEIKQHIIVEPGNISQHKDLLVQARLANANDNKCTHCDFVAHSFSSLDMHIKRKHTKEFEYYCMACDYYAVTRREMIRHAATEKHKIKRQSYSCTSSGEETDAADIAKETAIVSEEEQQPTEFQIIAGETKHKNNIEEKSLKKQNTSKVKKFPNYLVVEDSAASKIPREGYVFDAVDGEIESGSDESRVNAVSEENVEKDVKLGEVITPKETVDCALQKNIDDQETEKSELHLTVDNRNANIAFIEESPTLNLVKNKEKLGEDVEKAYESTEIPIGERKIEETQLSVLSETCSVQEQQTVDENTEKNIENMHNLEEQKRMLQSSITEEEDSLIDAQHQAEMSLNNVWDTDGSVAGGMQESNEALDAFTSAADRLKEGGAVQNFGQFDSSIVKLKSHEDGCEPIDPITDGQNLGGLKVYERPLKVDAPQVSAKRKKSEGHPTGESTRIRCDDCGFLADGLSGLNVHIAMKHPSKEKHFHCLLCGKSFYTESNLHQHLASAGHMRNEQASVEELPEGGATFKCVKCTEPFDSEQNLFLHIKEQHEEMLREVNKYIVEDTEQINREREENKGNICKYCGKMCRSSNSMAFLAHIRTHTGML